MNILGRKIELIEDAKSGMVDVIIDGRIGAIMPMIFCTRVKNAVEATPLAKINIHNRILHINCGSKIDFQSFVARQKLYN